MTNLRFDEMDSPLGAIVMACDSQGLCALDYKDHAARTLQLLNSRYGEVKLELRQDPDGCRSLLNAYFEGNLTALGSVRVSLGGTSFQKRVWNALRSIPAGKTASYGAIAAMLGSPGAARAVGLANSRNPVAIVVPCHRVVGASGSLTGYAGGLERKRWLLAHEGAAFE